MLFGLVVGFVAGVFVSVYSPAVWLYLQMKAREIAERVRNR